MDQTFDNGLRASTYELETSTVNVMDKSYEYNNDGSLKLVEDNLNWKFDRSYTYDHQTRLKDGKSSTEATGTEITNGGDQIANLPYRQSHSYDAFDNMTARTNKIWGGDANSSYTFSNNRISGSTWAYDADGRMTATGNPEPAAEMAYNAAGQLSFKYDKREPTDHEDKTYLYYDGDGRATKRVADQCRKLIPLPPEEPPEDCEWWGENVTYSIRSTVLGGEVLAEVNFQSAPLHRYMFAGGAKFGELSARNEGTWPYNYTVDAAQYYHTDPAGVSQRVTRNSPETLLGTSTSYPDYIDPRQIESETGGANVGLVSNYVQQPAPPSDPVIPFDGEASIFSDGQWAPVYLDGVRMTRQALRMMTLDSPSGFWLTTVYYRRTIEWNSLWITGITDRYVDLSRYFNVLPGKGLNKNNKFLHFKNVDSAKQFLEDSMDQNCKDKIAEFINKLAEKNGTKPLSTNLLDIFDNVNKTGGINLNYATQSDLMAAYNRDHTSEYGFTNGDNSLPYGMAFRGIGAGRKVGSRTGNFEGHVYTLARGFVPGSSLGLKIAGQQTLNTLIHELMHVSSSLSTDTNFYSSTYTDDDFQAAAEALGSKDVDTYINTHCKAVALSDKRGKRR